MKITLSVEKDASEVAIQCSVQGLAEPDAKERWTELMATVDKLLAVEEQDDPVTIRRGVCF